MVPALSRDGGPVREPRAERDRLVAAVGELSFQLGGRAVGVHHLCQRAGVSPQVFHELYADREACLRDAVARAQDALVAEVARAQAQARGAHAGAGWDDRVDVFVRAILAAFRADPVRGHLCVCVAIATGDGRALRGAALGDLARLLAPAGPGADPAEPVLAAALGAVWELLRCLSTGDLAEREVADAAVYVLRAPTKNLKESDR